MTPRQARLILVGFLLLGSAISANLLLLQERRGASAPATDRAAHAARVEAPARPRIVRMDPPDAKSATTLPSSRAQPAASPKPRTAARRPAERGKGRSARPPSTTASTR